MSPSLNEGDFIFTLSRRLIPIKIGDDVVFKDDLYGVIVKRIIRKKENGYYVKGTGSYSLDSDKLGIIPRDKILGKVILSVPANKKSMN